MEGLGDWFIGWRVTGEVDLEGYDLEGLEMTGVIYTGAKASLAERGVFDVEQYCKAE